MNHKIVTICRVAVAASMGVLIPWLIATGNPFLPVILMAVGITFIWFLVRKDKQNLVDERAQLIKQKASTMSITVFILGISIVGVVLITLSKGGYPTSFASVGYTLVYSACILLFLSAFLGTYYRHKYGG